MEVKIWGLPRSGTNYLRFLLESNYDVELAQGGGWKHSWFQWQTKNNIFVVKHPLAWLLSFYRFEKRQVSFDKFLRHPIVLKNGGSWKNPVAWWNRANEHWFDAGIPQVGFGALLTNPEETLNKHFERKPGSWIDTKLALRPVRSAAPCEFGDTFDPTEYLGSKYLSAYTADDLEFVERELDHVLLGKCDGIYGSQSSHQGTGHADRDVGGGNQTPEQETV